MTAGKRENTERETKKKKEKRGKRGRPCEKEISLAITTISRPFGYSIVLK